MIDLRNRSILAVANAMVFLLMTGAVRAADSTQIQKIGSADQAILAVAEYTGFDRSPIHNGRTFVALAEPATGGRLSNAFKHELPATAPIWRVSVDSVVLDIGVIDSATEREYPKTFDVFIDAETGILLKAVARSGQFADSMFGEPWADLPESLHVMKGSIITAPTNERPLVTLYEALNNGCMMSLLTASEIVAYYVECRATRDMAVTWIDRTPAPAWLIIAKQLKSPPPGFRNSESTHAKEPVVESCFINARTGVPSGTLTIQKSKSAQGNRP